MFDCKAECLGLSKTSATFPSRCRKTRCKSQTMSLMIGLLKLDDIIAGDVIGKWSGIYKAKLQECWNKVVHIFRPLAFVVVRNSNDVVATVKFCTMNKISLCIGSGTLEAYNMRRIDNSVALDLTRMNKVTIKPEERIAVVEAGALIGDLSQRLYDHSFVCPLGPFLDASISDCELHHCIGPLVRSYGFLFDNIVEYHLVDVRGYQLTVNETTNSDLFWGLKMYNRDFGIVTKYTLKLHTISEKVLAGDIVISFNDAIDALKILSNFMKRKETPRELGISVKLHIIESGFSLTIRFLCHGNIQTGLELFGALKEKLYNFMMEDNVKIQSYFSFQETTNETFPDACYCKVHPIQFATDMSDQYLEKLVDTFSRLSPDEHCHSACHIIFLGGAVSDFSHESSPFLQREASHVSYMIGFARTPDGYNDIVSIGKELVAELHPFDKAECEKEFDISFCRINILKAKHDPVNYFKFSNSKFEQSVL